MRRIAVIAAVVLTCLIGAGTAYAINKGQAQGAGLGYAEQFSSCGDNLNSWVCSGAVVSQADGPYSGEVEWYVDVSVFRSIGGDHDFQTCEWTVELGSAGQLRDYYGSCHVAGGGGAKP